MTKKILTISILFLLTSKLSSSTERHPFAHTVSFTGIDNHVLHDSLRPMPNLAAWFWGDKEFEPEGYKYFLDRVKTNSPYTILSTSIRVPGRDITDYDVHQQVKEAVDYAKEKGIGIALELDVRSSRRKFEAYYPDELQEGLIVTEISASEIKDAGLVVKNIDLSDHMTGRRTKYISLRGSLLGVYAYQKTSEGLIDPASLKDITNESKILSAARDSVIIEIPKAQLSAGAWVSTLVSFTHLTPDLFSPHIIDFQNSIIRSYGDLALAGTMLDEWGFPPSAPVEKLALGTHFWYSKYYAEAYSKKTGGRDLLKDCLLMSRGIKGQEMQREQAINSYMRLNYERNVEFEDNFYKTSKEVFGANSAVLVHPTWWPYPDRMEMKKNGLAWWSATRDWGQTDETTPFAVRTALAKKWNSPVWYNQFYNIIGDQKSSYQTELWSAALAGGRINFHPTYPNNKSLVERHIDLLQGNLMKGLSRINLLDYISKSQLDGPVAVIFGHTASMNWKNAKFEKIGMDIVDSLWKLGIPADLIPTSEIENNSLKLDQDGWISYGNQRYAAVLLYNPEFEGPYLSDFFKQASAGNTKLFRIGDWTMNFKGQAYAGNASLPRTMALTTPEKFLKDIPAILKNYGFSLHSPHDRETGGFAKSSKAPRASGYCWLIDGTLIQIAGEKAAYGDPIKSNMKIGKYNVVFDAAGVAAVRLSKDGNVEAIAAGGLKSFKTNTLEISLKEPLDLAIWKDEKGNFKGIIQGHNGDIPEELLQITKDWKKIELPQSVWKANMTSPEK